MNIYERFSKQCLDIAKSFFTTLDSENYATASIVIYGSGRCAKMDYLILKELGYSKRIVAFCDDLITEKKVLSFESVSYDVMKYEDIVAEHKDLVFYVGGTYKRIIEARLRNKNETRIIVANKKVDLLEDLCGEFMGLPARTGIVPCSNMPEYFENCQKLYRDECIERVRNLLEDEQSIQTFDNRVQFLLTGNINNLVAMYTEETIYFEQSIWDKGLTEHEVFLDVGAYVGDSMESFIEKTNGKYNKIYSIEPDYENYKKMYQSIIQHQFENCVPLLFATGNENGVTCFEQASGSNSKIGEGSSVIHVERLDDLFLNTEVTLIKMDIEGAELDTLCSAEELIKKEKPKIAVSIYHKPEDIYEIPLYLHKLVPEYKFKIRHHLLYSHYDTVLYAEA